MGHWRAVAFWFVFFSFQMPMSKLVFFSNRFKFLRRGCYFLIQWINRKTTCFYIDLELRKIPAVIIKFFWLFFVCFSSVTVVEAGWGLLLPSVALTAVYRTKNWWCYQWVITQVLECYFVPFERSTPFARRNEILFGAGLKMVFIE